jgi:hypothetical protein
LAVAIFSNLNILIRIAFHISIVFHNANQYTRNLALNAA